MSINAGSLVIKGYRMVNSRLRETARPNSNSAPRLKHFYQIQDQDLTFKKSEPRTLRAKEFKVMVLIKLSKMSENANKGKQFHTNSTASAN